MVREAVPLPVEENEVAGAGSIYAVLPLPPVLEPVGALDAPGEFGSVKSYAQI